MSDILEIKTRLRARAQTVAEMLLPNGHREAHEWRAGSTAGEKGQSLGVHLSGDKAGVWSDFATGETGDLIDLWMAARSVDLPAALDQIRDYLGIEAPKFERSERREYTRPPKPKCRPPQGRVRDYLIEDRNLPAEILDRYRIGEAGNDIVFPYLLPDGVLALAKVRKAEDGASPKPTAADCEPVLFGWQAMPANARSVLITEGEIDALSWASWDLVPAMSVPFGGGGGNKQRWIEGEYDRMARFETIYLALDMDEQGELAAEEIANRLGRHRCLRVKMPHKDGNECLKAGMTRDQMAKLLEAAEGLDPDGLRRTTDYTDKVVALFWPTDDAAVGYSTPYGKIGDKLLFRPAEVTLWTGATGSGKSQILSDCIVEWIRQGARVCIVSLEMKPAQLLKRMAKQIVGTDRPTPEAIQAAMQWLYDGLLIYDLVGKGKLDALLEVFTYARAKYGCDQFALDSLMRLGIAADDYNGQEAAVYRIVDWTVASEAHFHLVAHAKKGDRDRGGAPEAEDIKGAMEIGANAFNILGVWRNKKHEDEVKAAEALVRMGDPAAPAKLAELAQKPGVILNVGKQRNGDWEGKVGLWFDQSTYQYRSSHDGAGPRRYLPAGWNDHRRTA